jgi:adenosylcobinamide-GDP ribazoletransferase
MNRAPCFNLKQLNFKPQTLFPRELRIFFTALMFLTRLPVPRFADHSPEYLKQSSKYFPLVGWIVGGISAASFLLFNRFFSVPISVLASIITGILTTGAFHEDGFADVCDAFGGGWTKEKILEIMKDSRLGTYGTIGLVGMLAAKFLLLQELIVQTYTRFLFNGAPLLIAAVIISAHSISRLMSVISIQFYPYVTPDDVSKSKPSAAHRLSVPSFLLALVLALLPFLLLPLNFLLTLPVLLLATFLLNQYFVRWIDGHTGDCLGSVQQVTEVLFYLTLLLIWKFT